MYDDEYELVGGYADLQRSQFGVGVGNIIEGDKYEKIQQILRAQELTPKEKFLEAVQMACYTEDLGFDPSIYEMIADQVKYPQYINAKACVYAVHYFNNKAAFKDASLLTKLEENNISLLDMYRYSVIVSLKR